MEKKKWTVYIPEILPPPEPQLKILGDMAEIQTGRPKDEADLIAKVGAADAVLVLSRTPITRRIIEASPRLRMIGKYGVGVEGIDIEAATEKGILVANCPGMNCSAVAELTIGLMLAAMRHIQRAKTYIAQGGWLDASLLGGELLDSRVGIVGYGEIARCLIRKLQGFDLKEILLFTESKRNDKPEFANVRMTDLPTLLQESDIVSIHKSLTPRSKGLIGKNEIARMKKTAYLINTSRGSLIDEAELIKALREQRIAGAALDVFEQEPLAPDHPLLSLDNAVLTPHMGGSSSATRVRMVTVAAQNVADFLKGKRLDPRNVRNPEIYKP